jgi:hypothetical protein
MPRQLHQKQHDNNRTNKSLKRSIEEKKKKKQQQHHHNQYKTD